MKLHRNKNALKRNRNTNSLLLIEIDAAKAAFEIQAHVADTTLKTTEIESQIANNSSHSSMNKDRFKPLKLLKYEETKLR